MVARLWRRYAPYWHIFTAMAGASIIGIIWVNDVSGYGPRITHNTEAIAELKQNNDAMLEELRFNLKNIAERLGVVYIERGR